MCGLDGSRSRPSLSQELLQDGPAAVRAQEVILPQMRLVSHQSVLHFFSFLVYGPAGRAGGEWAGEVLPI